MLPAISELDLVINSDACEDQSTLCPLPLPTMWEESGAWLASGGNDSISPDKGPEEWDSSMASLLNLEGSGRFHQQRMTLYDIDDEDGTAMYCDTDGLMLSDDYAVTYLGGQKYMLDTGFLSLYGAEDTISWTVEDGTDITYNRTLPLAYLNGYVPSISYGLQVGSVDMNVSGSLVLGGYDSSRVLSEPVVVDGDGTFALKRVGMDSAGLYSSGGDYVCEGLLYH